MFSVALRSLFHEKWKFVAALSGVAFAAGRSSRRESVRA
jgi:hypothetical protein